MRIFNFFSLVAFCILSVFPSFGQTTKQTADSTLIVTEEGDTLVQYSYKSFDFGEIKHPSAEEKIPFIMNDEERKRAYEECFFSKRQKSDSTARRIAERVSRSRSGSYSVGSIPLVDGVSPSGARIYSIPVTTAPGNKLVPSVSLSYNSQAGEGLVGYGWDIGGLSSIRLTNKNQYYHGEYKAAVASAADAVFSLDGEPLVTNANSTQAPYTLITARSKVLVRAEYNVSGYIARFIALYPDGRRAVFGHDLNVAYNLPSYPVTEISDALGNKITFLYSIDSSNSNDYITQIRYGYDAAGNHHAEINFSYLFQPPHVMRYYAGKSMYIHCRISEIESRADNNLLHRYSLTYENTDNVYLLTQVDCQNSAEDSLPPLCFEYGADSGQPSFNYIYKNNYPIILSQAFVSGDRDLVFKRGKFAPNDYNDGVLIYPKYEEYDAVYGNDLLRKYKYGSTYPSTQTILLVPRMEDYNDVNDDLTTGSGFQTIEPVDVDGDGVDEIVKVNLNGTSGTNSVLKITVYKCNSSGEPEQISTFNVNAKGVVTSGSWDSPYRRSYHWGDFNGDGKVQLLAIAYDKNYNSKREYDQSCYATLIDIAGQSVISDAVLFSHTSSNQKGLIIGDIDADSRTELCQASSSSLSMYREQSSGSFALSGTFSNSTFSLLLSSDRGNCLTDLNGDGYSDIVITPAYGTDTSWKTLFFKGDSFSQSSFSSVSMSAGDTFMFLDLNHDGLPDLVKISGTQIGTALNSNGSYFDAYQVSPSSVTDAKGIVPGNSVNYAASSCFIKFDGFYGYSYSFTRNSAALRHLKASVDSYGRLLQSCYSYLPAFIWSDNTTSINPSQGYAWRVLPLFVLSSETGYMPESFSSYRDKSYKYYNSVVHNLGLGFCGFGKTLGIDDSSYPYTVVENVFNPMKMGVQTGRIEHLNTVYAPPYNSVTNTWDNHSTAYGKLSPRLTLTVVADSLHGTTATTQYTYDSYDFPTSIKTTRRLGSSTSTNKSETLARTYSHGNTPSRYLLGGVTEESLIKEQDGNGDWSWTQKTAWTLDTLFRPIERRDSVGKHGIIDVPIDDPSLPFPIYDRVPVDSVQLVRTTRWAYDSFGNIISEKSAPYDATEFLGDTLIYDAAGRFLLSKTDAQGHTTSYSGYNKFGSPAAVTDYRGMAKTFSYDSWGNLLQTGYADGSVETISREWTDGSWSCGSGDSEGRSVYAVTTTCTGKPSRIVHYDALGREVHSGNKRFDWYWQWTDRQYDLDGRLSKVSLPYRTTTSTASSPSASLWNTYTYDSYDRIESIAEASGRTTTWSYSGTSTTTVKDGISSTSTTDAAGNVVSVTDAGGTITYTLRDDGQPASVTAPGNVVTTFSYDGYGRRVGMDDPSVGERSYSYSWNADGSSQTTQSGPNGTITTSKDKYGRTTSVARTGEFTTTYSYDTYGRLTGETSTNGTSTTYTYDTLDRVSSLREDVPDGKWLKRDYSYGAGSNVSHVQYSSQGGLIAVEHYTYVNGHHIRTELQNGTLVFNVTSENDFGQSTGVSTQGVSRQYGFNAYGLPTQRSISVTGGNLQDFNYSFNAATGNLTSRFDSENGTEESFGYDSMNRLSTFSALNSSNSSSYGGYGYASNGNLTTLSPVGTVLYQDTDSPYLATALVPASGGGAVPLPKQAVTYNAYDRPVSISQNGITATFTYNGAEDRVKMAVVDSTGAVPTTLLTRYYIGGRYEVDVEPGTGGSGTTTTERFYLGGDAYSAPMVYVKGAGGANYWQAYNIGRDFLGSITLITTASGTPVAEYSYEPWGRMRNPETLAVYSTGNEPELFLSRGYTGHEFLPWFSLYNMNARLYDPLFGRFLSPDPYVQAPDFTQNFNRYSYCLNNPLKYRDKSGEFFGGTLFTAYLQLFAAYARSVASLYVLPFNSEKAKYMFKDAWKDYGRKVSNAFKIDKGQFQTDPNQSFFERAGTLLLRFTWSLVPMSTGNIMAHIRNNFEDVEVTYHHGATIVNHRDEYYYKNPALALRWGVTLGNFINAHNIGGNLNDDDIIQHELGHVGQGYLLGPLYYNVVGLPSLIGQGLEDMNIGNHDHDTEWYEVWANQNAYNYYDKHGYSNVTSKWDDNVNPRTQNPDWYFDVTATYYKILFFAIFLPL